MLLAFFIFLDLLDPIGGDLVLRREPLGERRLRSTRCVRLL